MGDIKKLKISIVLPFPVTKPVGGAKIMYEYANRLHQRGHAITIFHSIKRPFKKSSTPLFLKRLLFAVRGVARPKWFALHKEIKCLIVPEISNKYLPNADIILGTWWQMAYAINDLSEKKGKKFNLIQDYEIWKGNEENVHKSYQLPIHHLVIAKYLQQLVFEKSGKEPKHIPNAIDTEKFFLKTKISERHPHSIIMLYSEEKRKGTDYGLTVLKKLKIEFPDLNIILFGVYPPPQLPSYFEYHQRPNNLQQLYNQSAIFVSPSLGEGWALPPAEAMACGCAVVCTRIGGHQDYAIENDTAILFNPGKEADMYEKMKMMLNNQTLVTQIAKQGNEFIKKQFNWEKSVIALENYFFESL